MRLAVVFIAALLSGCSSPVDSNIAIELDMSSHSSVDADDTVDLSGQDSSEFDDAAPPDVGLAAPPTRPPELPQWLTGNPEDITVEPQGPGLILMGGGPEPDEAFEWWRDLVAGGDVVVLRVSGSDGYNDYLYSDIGGIDSVLTLKVDSAALADDPYVAYQVDHAEAVFLAGGNQWDYLSLWGGTALHDALNRVVSRGAVLGGTSAGLAVLGDRAFSAENDTVYSDEALADPYNEYMQFEDEFLQVPDLAGIVTDSHFRERDRMGRLVTFMARMWTDGWPAPVGLGVDESTALLIGPTGRRVVGRGAVYEVSAAAAPERCVAGQPLEFGELRVVRTTADATTEHTMSVVDGVLDVAPYAP